VDGPGAFSEALAKLHRLKSKRTTWLGDEEMSYAEILKNI